MSKIEKYLQEKDDQSKRLSTLQGKLTWPSHVTLTVSDYMTLSKERDILRTAINVSEAIVDDALKKPFSNFQKLSPEKNSNDRKTKIDGLFGQLIEASKVFDTDKVKIVRLAIAAAGEQIEKKTGYNPVCDNV